MKSRVKNSSQISLRKSMSRSLSVHQSNNSDNYEYAIRLVISQKWILESKTLYLTFQGDKSILLAAVVAAQEMSFPNWYQVHSYALTNFRFEMMMALLNLQISSLYYLLTPGKSKHRNFK